LVLLGCEAHYFVGHHSERHRCRCVFDSYCCHAQYFFNVNPSKNEKKAAFFGLAEKLIFFLSALYCCYNIAIALPLLIDLVHPFGDIDSFD
jgi:hypothetical protein